MEGFKQNAKMQCFKEGGYVTKKEEKRESKKEMKADATQDKKIVKKALSLHDMQQHEEKTDLSKLKKGGKARKCGGGSVRKYKAGGEVKKMAEGGELPQDLTDRIARKENMEDREMIAGPLRKGAKSLKDFLGIGKSPVKSDVAKAQGAISDAELAASKKSARGQGAVSDAERQLIRDSMEPKMTKGPMGRGIRKDYGSGLKNKVLEEQAALEEAPAYKKGGKAKKAC